MPSPTTNDEFIDLVRKSGVVDDKRLTAYLERLRAAEEMPASPSALAGRFFEDGVLTRFQAEHLLQGKWKRFTIGKYKVLEKLGSGGMGSVYLCEHTLMRRRVAVKVLPNKGEDTSSLDRFRREARAVAALDHPNIVRAYDIDQDGELHFLVMEHVDGASLQEIVKRAGPMDVLRAAHYIRQAALGLQHAHETAALVHRDVKPGNILVDRNGIVKLLDMGLARLTRETDDNLTKKYDESVLGTADYLAPEQARDSHNVDIRADIYSLGATFYFCLTGRTPFQEGTVALKLIWHQTRQPKPIRSLRQEVPEGIAAIVEKMMAKTEDGRYQTPQEVADALLAWTTTPIPPPPEDEMPKFSLAAKGMIAGETSTGPRTAELSPSPRKFCQVSGSAGSQALPAPTAPAPRTPASPPPSGGGGGASTNRAGPTQVTGPQPSAPPAQAGSVPRQPANNGPQRPSAAPLNGAGGPAPTVARVAAVVVQESPSWQDLTDLDEAPAARSNRSGKTSKARRAAAAQEEEQDEGPVSSDRVGSSRRMRGDPGPLGKNALWLGLGAAGLLVFFLVFVLVLYIAFASPKDNKSQRPEREPIRVSAANKLTLELALRRAVEGDRILLQDDISEANLTVTTKNLIIEAEPGKTITWKCPQKVSPDSKLLVVGKAAGLQLRGIRFAGEQRATTLISLYGKCSGAKFENLELAGYKKYGVLITNCEGDSANRVLFDHVSFTTPADATAVHFTILPALASSVPRNRFFAFRECAFEGAGAKVTQRGSPLDADDVELPSRITIDSVP